MNEHDTIPSPASTPRDADAASEVALDSFLDHLAEELCRDWVAERKLDTTQGEPQAEDAA